MTARLPSVLVLFALVGMSQPVFAAPARAKTLPQRNVPDAQILQSLHTKMAKSKIGADRFTYTVARGVVTFEGRTNVMQHKGAATRMAKASGAIAVKNNIRISDAAKAKALSHLRKNQPPAPSARAAKPTTASPQPEGAATVAGSVPRATVVR